MFSGGRRKIRTTQIKILLARKAAIPGQSWTAVSLGDHHTAFTQNHRVSAKGPACSLCTMWAAPRAAALPAPLLHQHCSRLFELSTEELGSCPSSATR